MSTDSPVSSPILEGLTPEQRSAVEHVEGPLLVLAGPGSGKTRVVTHRIAHMLTQGIPANQILALTFTNKAADEMRARLHRLMPNEPIWISTFHRFCARQLRRYAPLVGLEENYSILDDTDRKQALQQAINVVGMDSLFATPDELAGEISRAKRELISPDHYVPARGNPVATSVELVYPVYQRLLLTANSVDFDDLLMHFGLMLRENPELRAQLDARFRYILVDEYQDTNMCQYAIVRALSIDHPNLAVTGDPDQSIYGWRGANVANILEFERDYGSVRVVKLERNYRSTKAILRVADQLIRNNRQRKEKRLYTENDEGDSVRLVFYPNARGEAEHIAAQIRRGIDRGICRARDVGILYRANYLSRTLEAALIAAGVPYQIVSGLEFFRRKEIKDVLAYLHLINNPRNDVALMRVINTPARGIGKTTLQHLTAFAAEKKRSLLDAARQVGTIPAVSSRSALAVARFVTLYDNLRSLAHLSVREIIEQVVELSGYRAHLEKSSDSSEDDRLANVDELISAGRDYDQSVGPEASLEGFLEQSALTADVDNLDDQTDKATLMTLHAAKGLEFPFICIVGIEQGLIPHERSRHEESQLEEERRLLFVGITRAKRELQLSLAKYRASRGVERMTIPSPFLMELPRDEMEVVQLASLGSVNQVSASPWSLGMPDESAPWAAEPPVEWHEGIDEPSAEEPVIAADSPSPKQPSPADTSDLARLKTAADLLSNPSKPRLTPDAAAVGMLVEHPEYGPGRIVKLSGKGAKRSASVEFLGGDANPKSFWLRFAPLTLLDEDD